MSLRSEYKSDLNPGVTENTKRSTTIYQERPVDLPVFMVGIGNKVLNNIPLVDYQKEHAVAESGVEIILRNQLQNPEQRINLITMLCNLFAYEARLTSQVMPDAYLAIFKVIRSELKEQKADSDPIFSFLTHSFNEAKQDLSEYQVRYRKYVSDYLMQHQEFNQTVEHIRKNIALQREKLNRDDGITMQQKSALEKQLDVMEEIDEENLLSTLSQLQLDKITLDSLLMIKRKEKISQFKLMEWIAETCLNTQVLQGLPLLVLALEEHKDLVFVTSNLGNTPAQKESATPTLSGQFITQHHGIVDGQTYIFSEYRIPGDGNCGFSALGVGRKEAVQLLKSLRDDKAARSDLIDELFLGVENHERAPSEEINPTRYMDDALVKRINVLFKDLKAKNQHCLSLCEQVRTLLPKEGPAVPPKGFTDEYLIEHISKNALPIPLDETLKTQFLLAHQEKENTLAKMSADEAIFDAYVDSYGKGLWLGEKSMRCIAKAKGISLTLWGINTKTAQLQITSSFHLATATQDNEIHVILKGAHYNVLRKEPQKPLKLTVPNENKLEYLQLTPTYEFRCARERSAEKQLILYPVCEATKKNTNALPAYVLLCEPKSPIALQYGASSISSYKFQPVSSHQINPLAEIWRHFLFTEAAYALHQHITQQLPPYAIKSKSFYWKWLSFLLGPQLFNGDDEEANIALEKKEANIELERHKKMALHAIKYQLRLAVLETYQIFYRRKYQNETLEKYKRELNVSAQPGADEKRSTLLSKEKTGSAESETLLEDILTKATAGTCPILHTFFRKPILVWPSGRTYEEDVLAKLKEVARNSHVIDPFTRQIITHQQPNPILEGIIKEFIQYNAPYWQNIFKVLTTESSDSKEEVDYDAMVSHVSQITLPLCPMTKQPIRHPVVTREGVYYDKSSLAQHHEFKEATIPDYALGQLLEVIHTILDANCDLLLRSSPLDHGAMFNSMKSGSAYVRCGKHQLFYANKMQKTCVELKVTAETIARFDTDLKPADTVKTLSKEELKNITDLTKHTYGLPALAKQPLDLLKNLYWSMVNDIQGNLNELLSCYELRDVPDEKGAWLPTAAYTVRALQLQQTLQREIGLIFEESVEAKGLPLQVPTSYNILLISPADKAIVKLKENMIVLQQSNNNAITAYAINKGKIVIQKVEAMLTQEQKARLVFPKEDATLEVVLPDPLLVATLTQALLISDETEELAQEVQDRLAAKSKQICDNYADNMMVYQSHYHGVLPMDPEDRALERKIWVDYLEKEVAKEIEIVNKELKQSIKKGKSLYVKLMIPDIEKKLKDFYRKYYRRCVAIEAEAKKERTDVAQQITQQLATYQKHSRQWYQSIVSVSNTTVESKEVTGLLSEATVKSDSKESESLRDQAQLQSIQELIDTLGMNNLIEGLASSGQCVPARVVSNGYTLLHFANAHDASFGLLYQKNTFEKNLVNQKIDEVVDLLLSYGADPFGTDPKEKAFIPMTWNWKKSKAALRNHPLSTEFSDSLRQALWSYIDEKGRKVEFHLWPLKNIRLWIRGLFDSRKVNAARESLVRDLADFMYQRQKLDTAIYEKTKELLASLPKGSTLAAYIKPIMDNYDKNIYPHTVLVSHQTRREAPTEKQISTNQDAKLQADYNKLAMQFAQTKQEHEMKLADVEKKHQAEVAVLKQQAQETAEKLAAAQQASEAKLAAEMAQARKENEEKLAAEVAALRQQAQANEMKLVAKMAQLDQRLAVLETMETKEVSSGLNANKESKPAETPSSDRPSGSSSPTLFNSGPKR